MKIEPKIVEIGIDVIKEFEVRPLAHKWASEWRRAFNEKLGPQFEYLRDIPQIEFESPADLLNMIPMIQSIFIDAPDDIFDMVCLWSPYWAKERTWLEENAHDEQLLQAMIMMLEFADPFGLRRLAAPKAWGSSPDDFIELAIKEWGFEYEDARAFIGTDIGIRLVGAYLKRIKMEADILAVAVVNKYAEAASGKQPTRWVAPAQALAEAGVKIRD